MRLPSKMEVFKFMTQEASPYAFEYVKDIQPLRVSVDRKVVYVNERVLMDVIKDLINDGLDWREVMKKNLQHEKAHEKFFKWNQKWGVGARECGWLASYLTDIVIDKIYFAKDANYRKWLLADSRHAFKSISNEIWSIFPLVDSRAHFLYTQAAYWIAIGAVTLDEATELYPEKALYVTELSQLFNKIKNEEDLEWAFPKAKKMYFENFLT
jgi:hypothetical protein